MIVKNIDERLAVLYDCSKQPVFYVYENGELLKSSAFFKQEDIALENCYQKVYATHFNGRVYVYTDDWCDEVRMFSRVISQNEWVMYLEDERGNVWRACLERLDPYLHETHLCFSIQS